MRWFYPDLHSFSDHSYIYFEVLRSTKRPPAFKSVSALNVTDISRINLSLCKHKIAEGLETRQYFLPNIIPTKDSTALLISDLSCLLSAYARNSKLPRAEASQSSARKMTWWSKELYSLRHKAKQAFKLRAILKTDATRLSYVEQKATYQRELRRAKRSTWNRLRSTKSDGKELFNALKVLSGKSAGVSLPQNPFGGRR